MARDEDIREALRGLAARADECGPLPDLRPRLARARRLRRARLALSAVVTVLVLAAIGYGGYDALRPAPRLVVTDQDLPGAGQTTGEAGDEQLDSWRAAQIRDYFGLWAGNVETIPERPESLPAEFFEEPQPFPEDAIVPRHRVWLPEQLAEPLWVFAGEIDDLSSVSEEIIQAGAHFRPVVIFGADEREAAKLVMPSVSHILAAAALFPEEVSADRKFIAHHPEVPLSELPSRVSGFRASSLMLPVAVAPTSPRTPNLPVKPYLIAAEEVYWHLAALTLWQDLENTRPDLSPFGRPEGYPVGESLRAERDLPRAGAFMRIGPGSPDGEPRSSALVLRGDPGPFAPGGYEKEMSLWESGQPYRVVPGWDGYMYPVTMDELPRVISPAVAPPGVDETDVADSTSTSETSSPQRLEITEEIIYEAGWGEEVGEFGFEAPNESTGSGPESLAVHDDRLYIADPVNLRIQRIAPDGQVEQIYSLEAGTPRISIRDLAVAPSPNGTLVVLDASITKILWVFDSEGRSMGGNGPDWSPNGQTLITDLAVAGDAVYLGAVNEPLPLYWWQVFTVGPLRSVQDGEVPLLKRRPLDGGFELELGTAAANQEAASKPGVWKDGEEIVSLTSEAVGLEELGRLEARVAGDSIVVTGVGRVSGSEAGTQRSSSEGQQRMMWVFDLDGNMVAETEVPAVQAATAGEGDHTAFGPDGSLYILDTSTDGLKVRRYSIVVGE